MIRRFSLPLATSILGHACALALLVAIVGQLTPAPLPLPERAIEILLAPAPPIPAPPPVAETAPPEPPPPEPPPPVVEAPPPEPPPPPAPPVHKMVAKPPPPPRRPLPRPLRELPREPPPVAPPVQTAAIAPVPQPPPPAAPVISAGYRAALSAWLESNKHYPDSARSRGEEGRAVLKFRVDRWGRVLNYAVVQSTGYADLDAAIDQMMRSARLPPFTSDMTPDRSGNDVEVAVTIRFALAR